MIDVYATSKSPSSSNSLHSSLTQLGDSSLTDRTWVLLTEAPEGGWGLWGHAHLNDEPVAAARAEIAKLQAAAEQGAQQ